MIFMRTLFPAACVGLIALSLVGCGDVDPPYSSLVKYTVRTDPLVLTDKLGDDRYDPDRPGQLPLASLKDLFDPLHPLYVKKDVWAKEGLLRDPKAASDSDRNALEEYLALIFGTPANPTVGYAPDEMRDALKLDVRSLERGSLIYRVQCLHCHGVNGDGRGPTARWINPHPRDYRQGLFKFQSVDQTDAPRPPRRADLHRVIKYGVEGTAMPSFGLLPDSDIELLVSYIIHLSIRGKVEYALKDSVLRGQTLFLGIGEEGKAANCVSCHPDYGRQAKFRFDSWGTLVRPNNLTNGLYRGGRRTIDLYYRIHSGINGSGMASFGKQLKAESLWDLVNFVQTLPYPAMRKERGINID